MWCTLIIGLVFSQKVVFGFRVINERDLQRAILKTNNFKLNRVHTLGNTIGSQPSLSLICQAPSVNLLLTNLAKFQEQSFG